MTAVVPTTVTTISSRVDKPYGTGADLPYQTVVVDLTTTATSNTTDLNTYVSGGITAIVNELQVAVDGAVTATVDTWSGTTVTWASYAGSGVTNAVFLVY